MTNLLTSTEIEQKLVDQPDWSRIDNEIVRIFTLPSFPAALVFAGAVGHLAERADHHPEWFNVYNRVAVTLTTHDVGGLSMNDIDMARLMDRVAAALAQQAV